MKRLKLKYLRFVQIVCKVRNTVIIVAEWLYLPDALNPRTHVFTYQMHYIRIDFTYQMH